MPTDIVVPTVGESITEVTVARWLKHVGDPVAVDDPLVELETDKATQELAAQAAGTLTEIAAPEGSNVHVGGLLGRIGDGPAKAAATAKPAAPPAAKPAPAPAPPQVAPAAERLARSGPAARKLAAERGVDVAQLAPSGKDGRVTEADVLAARPAPQPAPAPVEARAPAPPRAPQEGERRVRMTRLRKRIAERLKEAQNTAAMLTTFNEADMTEVMAIRERYRDSFEKKHGVRLGFMSFFVKACI